MKLCDWCGEEIVRTYHSRTQWEKVHLHHGTCQISWHHYRCPRSEVPEPEDKHCVWCDKKLERRPEEMYQNFAARIHCNKSCSSLSRWHLKRKEPEKQISVLETQVVRYVPGTPEFDAIASLYRR